MIFLPPLVIGGGTLAMNFKPPTASERLRAIGSTEGLPENLRKALEPGSDFEPIPVPEPGDWLAVHRETGQSFDEFVKSESNRPDNIRSKIYLQPLGEFGFPQSGGSPKPSYPEACPSGRGQISLVEKLREYAAAYFAMQVEILPCLTLSGSTITTRINPHTRNRQILTGDVLVLLKKKLPADAFCLLAITMDDLYPDPSWNFVFGQASLRERVGVYSFARYDPAFYGDKRGKDYEELLLRRSCKVLVHETSHMFGLEHCIYFRCVMNGSNHLQESDSRSLHLCPVCLRKAQYSFCKVQQDGTQTRFDVVDRYRNLFRFYQSSGFDDEARWVANRLKLILGDEASQGIIGQGREQ
jgi:archaemetzincin